MRKERRAQVPLSKQTATVRAASPQPEQRHRQGGARRGIHARRGQPDTDAVFVDTSGRRRRLFVAAGVAGATLLILLAVALLAGFTGVGPANVPGWPGQHEAQGGTGAPDGSPGPGSAGQGAPSATPSAPSPAPSATAAPSASGASPSPSKRHGAPSTHPTGKK